MSMADNDESVWIAVGAPEQLSVRTPIGTILHQHMLITLSEHRVTSLRESIARNAVLQVPSRPAA
jgi:hypothetical protein